MITQARPNLPQLARELAAAGVDISRGLGAYGLDDESGVNVHTYGIGGIITDLPTAARAVLDAHVPAPPLTNFSDRLVIGERLRTTNATPAELWRATLAQRTGYRATLTLIAVDAGNGAVRTIEARVTAKRLTGNALLVGTPTVLSDQQDSGTSAWAITAAVSGADFVVTVTGAAGRNIDWLISGDVVSFTPGGR
mgnify:CR=1 FL=1